MIPYVFSSGKSYAYACTGRPHLLVHPAALVDHPVVPVHNGTNDKFSVC